MNASHGIITLDQLLALDLDEVQLHLDSSETPNFSNTKSTATFYRETQGIFLIIFLVDQFVIQPSLISNTEAIAHLNNLRSILATEYQSRLDLLSIARH